MKTKWKSKKRMLLYYWYSLHYRLIRIINKIFKSEPIWKKQLYYATKVNILLTAEIIAEMDESN